jgi:uncharacterized protein involved in oxidation of intracellular sulfur
LIMHETAGPVPGERSHEQPGSVLLILNDAPYGGERSYNGMRLAGSLAARDGVSVRVFLMGDAVGCALAGQKVPDGYYNLGRMLEQLIRRGGAVACCGSCLEARGIGEQMLVPGVCRSNLQELTNWTLSADRVITF